MGAYQRALERYSELMRRHRELKARMGRLEVRVSDLEDLLSQEVSVEHFLALVRGDASVAACDPDPALSHYGERLGVALDAVEVGLMLIAQRRLELEALSQAEASDGQPWR